MKQEYLEDIAYIKQDYEYTTYTNKCKANFINTKHAIKNIIYKIT